MISAILLAAGESKRMGQLKPGLPLGNSTILEQSIDNLVHSRIDELLVVLGYRAHELMEKVAGRPVKTVINPDYEPGVITAIIAPPAARGISHFARLPARAASACGDAGAGGAGEAVGVGGGACS